MIQKGDKITYHGQDGEVMSCMDDMAIVRLADNKEYSLPYNALKLNKMQVVAPTEMHGVMEALRPHIKNMNFLNDMATMMNSHGISELNIKSGRITKFEANESLEERIARMKAEASTAAEKQAREDYAKEHGMTIR